MHQCTMHQCYLLTTDFVCLSAGGRQNKSAEAAVKKKWQALEKSITQLALNKQTVASMEREMERCVTGDDGTRMARFV